MVTGERGGMRSLRVHEKKGEPSFFLTLEARRAKQYEKDFFFFSHKLSVFLPDRDIKTGQLACSQSVYTSRDSERTHSSVVKELYVRCAQDGRCFGNFFKKKFQFSNTQRSIAPGQTTPTRLFSPTSPPPISHTHTLLPLSHPVKD